ncbi:ATP-binding protein [Streptomyces halstedii]
MRTQLAPEDAGNRSALTWWVPRTPEGVPEARHRAQEAMRSWGESGDRADTAALVVTELVANAVQHTTGRRIRCRLVRTADGVRVCVWNRGRARVPAPPRPAHPGAVPAGPRAPLPRRPDQHAAHRPRTGVAEGPGPVAVDGTHGPEDLDGFDLASLPEGGRGLMLVDTLATRWGTRTSLSGRLVWADV